MKLGKISFVLFILFSTEFLSLNAEDKIISAPIINLENLEPSFENLDNEESLNDNLSQKLKERKKNLITGKEFSSVNLKGLDKITAKTKTINVKIGETVKFGLLEIKALKCGVLNKSKKGDSVAYIQVRDVSENQNEKVFIFNGWTFSSNPSLTPFDHAVYDIWLESCNSA